MNELVITNCRMCPFLYTDSDCADEGCTHPDGSNIILEPFEYMPIDNVHELCPLKKGGIAISIKESIKN